MEETGTGATSPESEVSGSQIEFRRITKRFGSFTAIKDFDLTIDAGEFVTLLGPSGSGKTTLLNLLAGFLEPDEGDILVAGRSVLGTPPHRRNFGMVFQNYSLFPHMSISENVGFPLRMRGLSRSEIDQKVERVLELLQLQDQAPKSPAQLSGGQQQRVAVARAIVFEPPVVIMDEPLSALDRRLREALQIELQEVHQRIGATIVYVTHDQSEALTMSDRVAVLNHGELLALGPPKTLYESPKNLFVASFLGESNQLSGVLVESTASSAVIRTEYGWITSAVVEGPTIEEGEQVRVNIRPERIVLSSVTSASDSGMAGVVLRTLFLGDTARVDVRLDDGGDLLVRYLNTRDTPDWEVGENVTVAWSPRDAHVIQPGAAFDG